MNIIVLSPHRDDAAFSVGLAIGTWISEGHTVEVMNCFTKSRYSPFGDLEFVHSNDMQSYVTALRLREDLKWCGMYQPPVVLRELNLRDAPQRLQCGIGEVCGFPPRPDDLSVAKIRNAVSKVAEDALVLPLGIGDHVDHVTARLAAYGNLRHSQPVAFYEDLPYAARPGMAEGIAERAMSLDPDLVPRFVKGPTDIEVSMKRKRDLALCYDSQVDSTAVGQVADFCGRYGGRERLWMNAAWRQSGLKGVR